MFSRAAMSHNWFSTDQFPDAPRRLPCDSCGQLQTVLAVKKLEYPDTGHLCSIDCLKCGRREILITHMRSAVDPPLE
jgi:hypothetical protein